MNRKVDAHSVLSLISAAALALLVARSVNAGPISVMPARMPRVATVDERFQSYNVEVTSFAVSRGVRDAAGVWIPHQARRFFDYTRSIGGNIAAAEFFNEPDMPAAADVPAGYIHGRDGVL